MKIETTDSQSDYSSDSDFDDNNNNNHNNDTLQINKNNKNKNKNEIIEGKTKNEINDLILLCLEINKNEILFDINSELGDHNWRDLFLLSMNCFGLKNLNINKNQISSSDYYKIFEKPQNNSHSSQNKNKNIKQLNKLNFQNNLTSIDSISISTENENESNLNSNSNSLNKETTQSINLLTKEKQKYVLNILHKMESKLENEDPILAHSFIENSSEIVTNSTNSSILLSQINQNQNKNKNKNKSSMSPKHHHLISSSQNLQYAFENKIKYGHVKGVLDKATTIIRKIRKQISQLTKKQRKQLIEDQIQVSLSYFIFVYYILFYLILFNLIERSS